MILIKLFRNLVLVSLPLTIGAIKIMEIVLERASSYGVPGLMMSLVFVCMFGVYGYALWLSFPEEFVRKVKEQLPKKSLP